MSEPADNFDALLATRPELDLTGDEREALRLIYRAVHKLHSEGYNLAEIAAMLGEAIDEQFLGLVDVSVAD